MPPAPITIRLDDERRRLLESTARVHGQSTSETVRDAIDVYLGLDGGDDRPAPDDAPRSLTLMERRTLSLLLEILANVAADTDEQEVHRKRGN